MGIIGWYSFWYATFCWTNFFTILDTFGDGIAWQIKIIKNNCIKCLFSINQSNDKRYLMIATDNPYEIHIEYPLEERVSTTFAMDSMVEHCIKWMFDLRKKAVLLSLHFDQCTNGIIESLDFWQRIYTEYLPAIKDYWKQNHQRFSCLLCLFGYQIIKTHSKRCITTENAANRPTHFSNISQQSHILLALVQMFIIILCACALHLAFKIS